MQNILRKINASKKVGQEWKNLISAFEYLLSAVSKNINSEYWTLVWFSFRLWDIPNIFSIHKIHILSHITSKTTEKGDPKANKNYQVCTYKYLFYLLNYSLVVVLGHKS